MASPCLGPRLPLEILGIVVSLVPETRTLLSLSICSRAFALFAEPILYAVVRFEPDSRGVRLARTLVQSRRKSKLVLSVTTSLIDRDYPLLPSAVKLIVRAIAGCSNLQTLSTCWGLKFSWAIRIMLQLVPAFQLRQFHSLLQWDLHVSDFLESQPTLEELGIVQPARLVVGNTANLSDSALPLLSTFMGRLPQALEVVPGRPITSIVLHGAVTLGDLASALPKLAHTSAPIEMISLQAEELSGDLLTLLSAYMPTLVRLEIRIVRSSMVAYSSLASETVCQAMALMSRLNYFRLRLRCPLLFSESFFHSQRDIVLEWNSHCGQLKKVVFEASSENKIIEWSYDEEAMDWVYSLDE